MTRFQKDLRKRPGLEIWMPNIPPTPSPVKPAARMRREPRPHQKDAIESAIKAFKQSGGDIRVNGKMPCGTGKTIVGCEVAISTARNRPILLVEPSLALVAQNFREWQAQLQGTGTSFLLVCSDQDILQNQTKATDNPIIDPRSLGIPVTVDPAEIRRFIAGHSDAPKVVVSTLHSTPKIAAAYAQGPLPPFHVGIVDEAHLTTTRSSSAFATVLHQHQIPIRRRFFLTATPRFIVSNKSGERVFSMDDEKVYGKRCYDMTFARAIEQNLLTDYRVIVAAISEREAERLYSKLKDDAYHHAVCQLALLRAAKDYGLSKIMTFHNRISRAEHFSDTLPKMHKHILPERPLWTQWFYGGMTNESREQGLQILNDLPKDHLAVASNCKCLGIGVDVPTLDGVAFCDQRREQTDIIQTVGRAIRRSDDKEYGNVIVPVVLTPGEAVDDAFDKGRFRVVGQVLRALAAHDERFEGRILKVYGRGQGTDSGSQDIHLDIPEHWKSKVRTQIVMTGLGLRRQPLFEEDVIKAARLFFGANNILPSSATDEPVPGLPGESWKAINLALALGNRGFSPGGSLAKLLEPLRIELGLKKENLTEDDILSSARTYYELHGKLPTSATTREVPGMPSETWGSLESALISGSRGLGMRSSLSKLLKPLRKELGIVRSFEKKKLTEAMILRAARAHFKIHKKLPSCMTKGKVKGLHGETWANIDSRLKKGGRGLSGGRTLFEFLGPLRKELKLVSPLSKGNLSVGAIVSAAREFYSLHKVLPSASTKKPVPGLPNERWNSINRSLIKGQRGLPKNSSLFAVLAPLRQEMKITARAEKNQLSEIAIVAAAEQYYAMHGRLPSKASKESVPGMPKETWSGIHQALSRGYRGLSESKTLSSLLEPLRTRLRGSREGH